MKIIGDPIDRRLLDDWQRDLPICDRPFHAIARAVGTTEEDVLERLEKMRSAGRVTRVGATCAPNSVSASTLAAVAVPDKRIDHVAAIVSAQEGVNHSYQREDRWNLWFVATGPDRAHVDATLASIGVLTGLQVLDLRLVRLMQAGGESGAAVLPGDAAVLLEELPVLLLERLQAGLDVLGQGGRRPEDRGRRDDEHQMWTHLAFPSEFANDSGR